MAAGWLSHWILLLCWLVVSRSGEILSKEEDTRFLQLYSFCNTVYNKQSVRSTYYGGEKIEMRTYYGGEKIESWLVGCWQLAGCLAGWLQVGWLWLLVGNWVLADCSCCPAVGLAGCCLLAG